MVRPISLLLPSVLFFYSVCVVGASVGQSEMAEDVKNSNSRSTASHDPFMSVTMGTNAGEAQSSLFSKCLAASRTLEATFASIEVAPGLEFIRYTPDSFQLRFPVTWNSLTGNFPSILDCAKAAHDGGWIMFKYDGAKCEVVNTTYGLNDTPRCEGGDPGAVFILSSAADYVCPLPRFRLFEESSGTTVCGLVNEDLMTFDEATNFCKGVYHTDELMIFDNGYFTSATANATAKLIERGYTNTNLWVGAYEYWENMWAGNFGMDCPYFVGEQCPVRTTAPAPLRAAYMDPTTNFKLRVANVANLTAKAGVFCSSYLVGPGD